jgi:hypothetical protein
VAAANLWSQRTSHCLDAPSSRFPLLSMFCQNRSCRVGRVRGSRFFRASSPKCIRGRKPKTPRLGLSFCSERVEAAGRMSRGIFIARVPLTIGSGFLVPYRSPGARLRRVEWTPRCRRSPCRYSKPHQLHQNPNDRGGDCRQQHGYGGCYHRLPPRPSSMAPAFSARRRLCADEQWPAPRVCPARALDRW